MTHAPKNKHAGQEVPDPSQEQRRPVLRSHHQPSALRIPQSYGTMATQQPRCTASASADPLPPPCSPSRSGQSRHFQASPVSAYSSVVAALDLATGNLGRTTAEARRASAAATPRGRGRGDAKRYQRRRRNTGCSNSGDIAVPTTPISPFTLNTLPLPTTSFLTKHVPLLSWLVMRPGYNWKNDTVPDLFAGLSVAIVIIPQSVAYALLASLPPVYGLYTSLVPPLVYTIFGTSRHMSPGTFAITSLLLGQSAHKILADQGLHDLAPSDPAASPSSFDPQDYQQRYLALCFMMTFMIGIIQVVLGFARLGRWISRSLVPTPLVSGFNTASAFHIGTHQIKHLLGVAPPRFSGAFSMLRTWFWILDRFLDKVAWPTLGLGVAAILTMVGLQRIEHWRRKRCRSPAAAAATAPATSDQSLLTAQDVAMEQESRLGRQSLDSPLSSASASPALRPVQDALTPTSATSVTPTIQTPNMRLSPGQGYSSHSLYGPSVTPETGLYNTGAAHSRPQPKPQHYSYSGKNSSWRHSSRRPPLVSRGHSLLSPDNYSTGSFSQSRSDEELEDEETAALIGSHSPSDSVYGTSGQDELYIDVHGCYCKQGNPRSNKIGEDPSRSSAAAAADRRGSSHSVSAVMEGHEPLMAAEAAAPAPPMPGPWTPLLSGSSGLSGRGWLYGAPKEARVVVVQADNRPPSRLCRLCRLCTRYLQPIYAALTSTHFPIPDIFLCLVFWTGVTVVMQLDVEHAVKVVGPIPTGLPSVHWPPLMGQFDSWGAVAPLLWPSFLMALVIYVMTLAVGKHFGKQFEYEVDPDQEMRAIGLGSLVGSCFGGYACTGNLTRSAILAQTGARTPLATIVSCMVVLMTLLWWTVLIERVPETVLAAVVLVSLQSLMVQAFEARGLWRVGRRMDAVIWWTTFSTVMVFSIEIGLAVGMAVVVLYQIKKHIRGWKQAICHSVLYQRIMLILGLQSPLHTSSSRGWHAGDDDDDY